MRYILIVNSRTSPKNKEALDNAISEIASSDPDLRARIEIRYTEYGGHASDIAQENSEAYGDKVAIVACGGDGTIHEIANVLAFRKTPLICLPFGTGNDFIKTVLPSRKARKFADRLRELDKVTFKPIDLCRVDSYDIMGINLPNWSSYFNNVTSIGLDTRVQAAAKALVLSNGSQFNRKTAYARAAIKSLFGNRDFKFKYQLELENGDVYNSETDVHTLISICNGKYYGNGFCPAPKASITDGVVDVCAIEHVSLLRAIYSLALYKFGLHAGHQCIKTFRATSGVITCTDSSMQLEGNYDGEDFFGQRVRFEVYPAALKLGFFPENKKKK